MQIPLDHYRMLGVPYRATPEQIQQACRDRQQQKPLSGYSAALLASREALLTRAYQTLADPACRARYDEALRQSAAAAAETNSSGAASGTAVKGRTALTLPPMQLEACLIQECQRRDAPCLEIRAEQFLGALLILFEVGEYAFVKHLARTCLRENWWREGSSISPGGATEGERRTDLVLLATVAHRELGRELGQRQRYQQAAVELEAACQLIATESTLTVLQRELADELARLRPFEIWEILTLPKRGRAATQRALSLLATLLEDRGGIDGSGDRDRSALSADEFLRFIQQLRGHLDADEQAHLFAVEARRSSPAAAYLLAYTQIARGFATQRPSFVVEATTILERIERRHRHQDVTLERAVCALLLGQTERAIETVERSRDRKFLEQLQQASAGSADPLLGLCRFSERWLHQEVLPKFRDLSHCQLTLKGYFADPRVQAELERLAMAPRRLKKAVTRQKRAQQREEAISSVPMMPVAVGQSSYAAFDLPLQRRYGGSVASAPSPVATAMMSENVSATFGVSGASTMAPAEGLGARRLALADGDSEVVPFAQRRRRPRRYRQQQATVVGELTPPDRWRLIWATAILGAVGVGATTLSGWWSNRTPVPVAERKHLAIRIDEPLLTLPAEAYAAIGAASARPPATAADVADRVLSRWLAAKARAYGADGDVSALAEVLTGAPLAQHQQWAAQYQGSGRYRQFEHEVATDSVRTLEQNAGRLVFEATVREVATDRSSLEGAGTPVYDSNLRVRYELVESAPGAWKIADVRVLEKLR